jgi:hypothetical protein
MSGCLLIAAHISCYMTHILGLFNSECFAGPRWYTVRYSEELSLLFNMTLCRMCFPGRWKLFYVTSISIFKKGRRKNVKDNCGVAILSGILKRFELLVYRTMYDDLKNLIFVNQHGFMKIRSRVTNLLKRDGKWFPDKGFLIEHSYILLLEEMSVDIDPARCL